jgi:senataxin
MRCRHINAPEILWGPPGSGKTEVAAAILHLLFHWQYRVLVCVPSEKVISRFINKFKELFPSFNLSQMTLLNDMDVVEKCDTFDKMSLENRAQELYCCTYTWRSWMKELYFVLEMKPYCQGSCYHEGRICKKNNQIIFSLESFRKKICALIFDLSECSEDLISSLSGKCIYDDDVANLNKLMTELSQFKDLMLSDIITTSDMKWAFQFASSLHLVSEVANRDIAESINAKRMSCLNLMEILIDSFELPLLEDRKNLEDFCIGHSRVIICTPSSISRLLKLKLTSFDTLLVDDASQIKEIDLLIPLAMTRKHVILVGDHLHLQPMVKSEVYIDIVGLLACSDLIIFVSSLYDNFDNISFGKLLGL